MNRQLSTNNRIISLILALACALQILLPVMAEDWGLTTGAALGESVLGDSTLGESTLGESATLGISVSPTAADQYVYDESGLKGAINNILRGDATTDIIYIGKDIELDTPIAIDFDNVDDGNGGGGTVAVQKNRIEFVGEKQKEYKIYPDQFGSGFRIFDLSGSSGELVFDKISLYGNKNGGSSTDATSTFKLGGIKTSVNHLTLDGVNIQYSRSTSQNGAGIYMSGGTLELVDATIQNCGTTFDSNYPSKASGDGGGVYVDSGNLTINGGEISYNYVSVSGAKYGGGVYFNGNGTLTLIDAAIGYNWARYGGGIYTNSQDVTINLEGSSKIYYNYGGSGGNYSPVTSPNNRGDGAGIYASAAARIEVDGTSEISDNWSMNEGYGGGIYAAAGSSITLRENAVIDANSANASGGGIYMEASSSPKGKIIVKDNVRITNNTGDANRGSQGFGGGIYAGDNNDVYIGDPTITPDGRDSDAYDDVVWITGNQLLNATGGAGVYVGDGRNASTHTLANLHLENLYIYANVVFKYNVTPTGYQVTSSDTTNWDYHENTYVNHRLNNIFSSFYTGGIETVFPVLYNNYDVGYPGSTTYGDGVAPRTVNLYPNGGELNGSTGTSTKPVSLYSTFGALGTPTRVNYAFKGWYTAINGDNRVDAGTTVLSVYQEQFPSNPTTITANISLYAQWEELSYAVTFDANGGEFSGGTTTQTVNVTYTNASSGVPSTSWPIANPPTRAGYTFNGWFTDDSGSTSWNSTAAVTDDITVYAGWTLNPLITVYFNPDGGSTPSPVKKEVRNGEAYGTLATTSRYGYDYEWYTEDPAPAPVYAATTVNKTTDHNLVAHWTPISARVSFNTNGAETSTPSNQPVKFNSPYGSLPTGVTKAGYTFGGWCTANNSGNGDSSTIVTAATKVAISGDHTLYAYWTPNTIRVDFNANDNDGGSTSAVGPYPTYKTVTYGNSYGDLATINRIGYDFGGWFDNAAGAGTEVGTGTTVNDASHPHTLYAKWTAKNITVTFDYNGGIVSQPTKGVVFDQEYGTLPNPAHSSGNYTFAGWYTKTGTQVDQDTYVAIPDDHTLIAQWTGANTTVIFNLTVPAGTTATVDPPSKEVIYLQPYGGLPTPKRTGYDFVAWYTESSGGTEVNSATTMTSTASLISIYARWTPKTNIEVTLNANSGSSPNPTRFWVTYDDTYTALANATASRKGYSLMGWNTQADGGGATVTPGSIVKNEDPHTLYAQWDINSYTMKYDTGSSVTSEDVVYDTLVTAPTAPTRPGYRFEGWYTEGYTTQWNFSTDKMPDHGVTLYAKWTALPPVFTACPDKALNFNTTYAWLNEVMAVDYDPGGSQSANIIVTGITDNLTGGSLATTTPLDTSTAGSYTVTYSVTNPLGVTATVTRTIQVGRSAPGGGFYPEINANDAYLSLNESYTWMTDVTAVDVDDVPHDITDKVQITSITDTYGNTLTGSTLSTSTPNKYLVGYTVTDSDGNVTVESRSITVGDKDGNQDSSGNDTYKPWIVAPNAYLSLNDTYTLMNEIQAWDHEDGNITRALAITEVKNIKGEVVAAGTFNTAERNLWTVSYEVTDSDNNKAVATRIIKVGDKDGKKDSSGNDTYLPWIIAPDKYLALNAVYTWLTDVEAYDLDDVPHDLTGEVYVIKVTDIYGNVMSGMSRSGITPLDTSVPNKYTVEYQVTDGSGNTVKASRLIKVGELDGNTDANGNATYKPWIVAENVNVELNSGYTLRDEVTAWDPEDDELTSSIVILEVRNFRGQVVQESEYTTAEYGKWYVDYQVTDSNGNVAEKTRYIGVGDIGVNGDMIPWIIAPDHEMELGDNYGLMTDVEGWDVEDGEITSKVTVIQLQGANGKAVDISSYSAWTPNIWTVTYEVTDSAGNTRQYSRVISSAESDGNGKHIPWIVAPDKTRKAHETYGIMQEIEAWDLEDGNITDKVKIVKVLFFNTEVSQSHYKSTGAGSWVITYEVTDSDGNTVQATRFIEQPSSDSNTSGDNKVVTSPTTYTPKASAGAGETGTDGSSTGSGTGENDDLVPDTDIEDHDLDGNESSTPPEKDNPSTGDLTPIGIMAVVAVCSLCVLMFMIIKKRKSRKQK